MNQFFRSRVCSLAVYQGTSNEYWLDALDIASATRYSTSLYIECSNAHPTPLSSPHHRFRNTLLPLFVPVFSSPATAIAGAVVFFPVVAFAIFTPPRLAPSPLVFFTIVVPVLALLALLTVLMLPSSCISTDPAVADAAAAFLPRGLLVCGCGGGPIVLATVLAAVDLAAPPPVAAALVFAGEA